MSMLPVACPDCDRLRAELQDAREAILFLVQILGVAADLSDKHRASIEAARENGPLLRAL